MKKALITGASSGIGETFARHLARQGTDLVLVARRLARLEALATELSGAHGVRVQVIDQDLSLPDAPQRLLERVEGEIDGLVNNAGFGMRGALAEQEEAAVMRMLDVNVRVLTGLTRKFLPGMLQRRAGSIINVASTAAFQPIPYMAVYAATKAYVVTFSEGLAQEVGPRGVKVVVLCPGATATEFSDIAGTKEYERKAARFVMTTDPVVACALDALKHGRVVAIPGAANQLGAVAAKLSPWAVSARVAGRIFGD